MSGIDNKELDRMLQQAFDASTKIYQERGFQRRPTGPERLRELRPRGTEEDAGRQGYEQSVDDSSRHVGIGMEAERRRDLNRQRTVAGAARQRQDVDDKRFSSDRNPEPGGDIDSQRRQEPGRDEQYNGSCNLDKYQSRAKPLSPASNAGTRPLTQPVQIPTTANTPGRPRLFASTLKGVPECRWVAVNSTWPTDRSVSSSYSTSNSARMHVAAENSSWRAP